MSLSADRVKCLGIPDRFVDHGERGELLTELGLDPAGLAAAAHDLAAAEPSVAGDV